MAQGIVNLFESVKIEEGHRKRSGIAMRLADTLIQQSAEHTAVRQSGERIVICQIFDAFRVGKAGLAFMQPDLRQLPVQASHEGAQCNYQHARKCRPRQKLNFVALRPRQLLIYRKADDRRDRKAV